MTTGLNFWDIPVWSFVLTMFFLFFSMMVANTMRNIIRPLRKLMIPSSVLGGLILLLADFLCRQICGKSLVSASTLEMLTYHGLGLGFVAMALRNLEKKKDQRSRTGGFDSGVTVVSTYLIQALVGLLITMICYYLLDSFWASGLLLPMGFGQGPGQAYNWGHTYETVYGFTDGTSFGLTIAAMGFLSASIGGVIHLNILRRRGRIKVTALGDETLRSEDIQKENEVPMQGSIDKMTLQVALIFLAYLLAYLLMMLLGRLLPGMRAVVYGFNFLLGVLSATLIKGLITLLKKANIIKKEYRNDFLMTRAGNFFFDVMVVAGIAAIRLSVLENYWGVILILGAVGAVLTYFYNRIIAKKLFPNYVEEQFLMMYGMLTGTASTGIILLREIDGDFRTPAADNMVYQNFPAIALGFPMMLLATLAPEKPVLTMIILAAFFLVLQFVLFRSYIFKKKTEKK